MLSAPYRGPACRLYPDMGLPPSTEPLLPESLLGLPWKSEPTVSSSKPLTTGDHTTLRPGKPQLTLTLHGAGPSAAYNDCMGGTATINPGWYVSDAFSQLRCGALTRHKMEGAAFGCAVLHAACVARAHISADSGERGALIGGVWGEVLLLLRLLLSLLGGVRTGAAAPPAAGTAEGVQTMPAAWHADGLLAKVSPPLWPAHDKQRTPCRHTVLLWGSEW